MNPKDWFWGLFGWRHRRGPLMDLWIRCPGDDRMVYEKLLNTVVRDVYNGEVVQVTYVIDAPTDKDRTDTWELS